MEKYLKEYLNKIGMQNNYSANKIKCEICSSEENTIIREQVSIGKTHIYHQYLVIVVDFFFKILDLMKHLRRFLFNQIPHLLFKKTLKSFVDDQISRGKFSLIFLKTNF